MPVGSVEQHLGVTEGETGAFGDVDNVELLNRLGGKATLAVRALRRPAKGERPLASVRGNGAAGAARAISEALTLEPLTGFPLAQVRTVASEPHLMVEALTAAPDALSRDSFPVATPGRPYGAALRLSVDALSSDRSPLAA